MLVGNKTDLSGKRLRGVAGFTQNANVRQVSVEEGEAKAKQLGGEVIMHESIFLGVFVVCKLNV